jgi:hypothetical protein
LNLGADGNINNGAEQPALIALSIDFLAAFA